MSDYLHKEYFYFTFTYTDINILSAALVTKYFYTVVMIFLLNDEYFLSIPDQSCRDQDLLHIIDF